MVAGRAKFDPISYAQQLRSVGVSQDQADIQAQAIEQVINEIATNQDLATKQDLQIELANLRVELIKWMLGIAIAWVVALTGILKYLPH